MNGGARPFTYTYFPYIVLRNPFLVFLFKYLAFAFNGYMQECTQRIYTTHTNTMQTTGYFIGILIEFTPGMKHGHNHFQRTSSFFQVNSCGDTPTIIFNGMELSS